MSRNIPSFTCNQSKLPAEDPKDPKFLQTLYVTVGSLSFRTNFIVVLFSDPLGVANYGAITVSSSPQPYLSFRQTTRLSTFVRLSTFRHAWRRSYHESKRGTIKQDNQAGQWVRVWWCLLGRLGSRWNTLIPWRASSRLSCSRTSRMASYRW